MSKHCWVTETGAVRLRIEAGFDRMLGGFFMNVTNVRAATEGFLYDSLADEELFAANGFPKSLERYVQVLGDMGVTLPALMVDGLLNDQRDFVGNRIVVYNEDGSIKSG